MLFIPLFGPDFLIAFEGSFSCSRPHNQAGEVERKSDLAIRYVSLLVDLLQGWQKPGVKNKSIHPGVWGVIPIYEEEFLYKKSHFRCFFFFKFFCGFWGLGFFVPTLTYRQWALVDLKYEVCMLRLFLVLNVAAAVYILPLYGK